MLQKLSRVTNSPLFQNAVLALIVFNAVLLGFETDASFRSQYEPVLALIHSTITVLFLIELALRILACAPRFWSFFRDGWNLFDFFIVLASLLPSGGQFATVARLARILRLLRVVTLSQELRLIVGTMLRSLPSMGHVIALLSILLYVYAIVGNFLFAPLDPEKWGTLKASLLTLFQVLTLEGWVELQDRVMLTYPFAWVYFISFIIIAVFVVINLFIAVVTNNLQSVKEDEGQGDSESSVEAQLAQMRREIMQLSSRLQNQNSRQ
jgi:voltage-gated sodium channel